MALPTSKILFGLRIAQGLFALIVLILSAYVVNWYDSETLTASPSQVNFVLFESLFALLSLAYLELAPRFAVRAHHPWASFVVELLNVIFFFAGFIALAVFLGGLLFCRGSVCAAARADAVFAAFSWVLWVATTTIIALELFRNGFRRSGDARSKSTPMSEPNVGA